MFATHCSWCHGNYLTTICEQWPHVPFSCLETWWCLLATMKTNTMQSYPLTSHCDAIAIQVESCYHCLNHVVVITCYLLLKQSVLLWSSLELITFINRLGNSITFIKRRAIEASSNVFLQKWARSWLLKHPNMGVEKGLKFQWMYKGGLWILVTFYFYLLVMMCYSSSPHNGLFLNFFYTHHLVGVAIECSSFFSSIIFWFGRFSPLLDA